MYKKQKILPAASLLTGAMVWGLIWYPYRALAQVGIRGELVSLLNYSVALCISLIFFRKALLSNVRYPWILLWIGVTAGWANFAYLLAVLYGEVMQVLLLFYLAPFWTLIFARLLLGERLNCYGYGVVLTSLMGAVLMLWPQGTQWPIPTSAAEWLGISAGMMFALSNVLIRKAAEHSIQVKSISVFAGVAFLSLMFVLYQAGTDIKPINLNFEAGAWLIILLLSAAVFAVNLAVQYGLDHLPANRAIVILLFELVVAAISSFLLVGETLNTNEWLGGWLIIVASLFSGKLHDS